MFAVKSRGVVLLAGVLHPMGCGHTIFLYHNTCLTKSLSCPCYQAHTDGLEFDVIPWWGLSCTSIVAANAVHRSVVGRTGEFERTTTAIWSTQMVCLDRSGSPRFAHGMHETKGRINWNPS